MKKKTRNKIISLSPKEGVVLPTEVDINTYKVMYGLFNAKPDVETKFLKGRKKIEIEDINDLNNKIQEKLEILKVVTSLTSADITFYDKRLKNFSNISDFFNYNWNTSQKIKTINLIWNFSIKIEKYPLPQPHTLTLRLGSKPKPSEIFHVIMDQNDSEMDEYFSSAVCKVDFVNRLISEELITIVFNWYESLSSAKEGGYLEKLINKYDRQIADFVPYLFVIVILILIYSVVNNTIEIPNQITNWNILFKELVLGIIIASIVIIISFFSGKLFGHYKIYHTLSKLNIYTMFEITNGDKEKNKNIEKDNWKLINELGKYLLVWVVTSIFAYLLPIIIKLLTIKG